MLHGLRDRALSAPRLLPSETNALHVDNYLEGYHIPIAHPGLMKEIDYAQYRTDTFRYYSQQFAPIRAMKAEDAGERLYAPGAG